MTFEFMRWCDRWLGKPASFLAWMLSPLLHRNSRFIPGQKVPYVRRIRVIKLFGMGSLLLATPALQALREAYPGTVFEIVTAKNHSPFIRSLGIFDRIYGISLAGIPELVRGVVRLLLSPRPDISINLEYYTWLALALQTIQRSRVRVGFAERQWLRRRLLDVPVHFNHRRHIRRIFGAVAEELGVRMASYELSSIDIGKADRESAREALSRSGFASDRPLIAVHIGASPLCPLRQWPLDRFRELLGLILNHTGAAIILTGGPEEKAEAQSFSDHFTGENRFRDLVGELSIPATIALLGMCSILITNDSGLLHWAVAVDTPTISFFGPETPQLYGPPEGPRHWVFYSGRYCSPCITTTRAKSSECRDNLCLKDIGVGEVFEAVQSLLDQYGKGQTRS